MSKILNKRVGGKSRLVKIAAAKGGLDFSKILQDRNVRSGLAGLGVAGISKLLGASWGTSALLGLGSAAAAHYGQKAWDKYNSDRQYNAQLNENRQAKQRQDEIRKGLEDHEQFHRGMLEEEEAQAKAEELRSAEEDAKKSRAAALAPFRQKLAKLNFEREKLAAKMGKTKVIFKPGDFSDFMWLRSGYNRLKDWNDRRLWDKGADDRRLKALDDQIKKLQTQIRQQNY